MNTQKHPSHSRSASFVSLAVLAAAVALTFVLASGILRQAAEPRVQTQSSVAAPIERDLARLIAEIGLR